MPRAPDGSSPALSITAGELAGLVGASLTGDAGVVLTGVASLEVAGPTDLSFVRSDRFASAAASSKAGALLVTRGVTLAEGARAAVLTVDDADRALQAILGAVRERRYGPDPVGVHPRAIVDEGARLGEGVFVGPGAVIEAGATIGDGTRILAGSIICAGVTIGARCIIGPNAVIGSDGFGHLADASTGRRTLIPHAGGVRLGDEVEVGANSSIDRGKLADTVIGRGTKIDNLVQVGHNCVIGEDCVLCGLVGLAGSVRLGDRVIVAGQVGVADNIRVPTGTILMAQAGVSRSIETPGAYIGSPARPRQEFAGEVAVLRRLVRQRKADRKPTRDTGA
ncbi:MAG: UDP-3-O-(3-hydroxymyristoyl)glucosamine N-acyltransferase [Phycisphaerales bacterium]